MSERPLSIAATGIYRYDGRVEKEIVVYAYDAAFAYSRYGLDDDGTPDHSVLKGRWYPNALRRDDD